MYRIFSYKYSYNVLRLCSSLVLRKQLHRNYEREAKTFVILTYFNANLQQPLGFRGVNLWPLEPVVL